MTFDPNKIPVWLRRTPEQQAKDQAYQETLKQALGPGRRPNRTEAHLLRAAAIRTSAEAQLAHLETLPEADPAHVAGAKAQLAEALAMQGDFQTAAKLHPSPDHAAHFQKIAEAIDLDDDAPPCDCPIETHQIEGSARPLIVPSEIIREMVFSKKHNKLMPLVECVKCGHANVQPAPQELAKRMNSVQEAHRKAKEERRA